MDTLVSRECPDPTDPLVTLAPLVPLDTLDPEALLVPPDPLVRMEELEPLDLLDPLDTVDPRDTSAQLVPLDLPVCPDPPAPLVAPTTSLVASMSTPPTRLP